MSIETSYFPVNNSSRRDKTSSGVLPRTEEEASSRVSIDTSSNSLIFYLGQSAQLYISQSIINPTRKERIPRVEENISGRGKSEPSGGGESLGQRKIAKRDTPEYVIQFTVNLKRIKTSGGELPRTEEEMSSRMPIDTSSTSLR